MVKLIRTLTDQQDLKKLEKQLIRKQRKSLAKNMKNLKKRRSPHQKSKIYKKTKSAKVQENFINKDR